MTSTGATQMIYPWLHVRQLRMLQFFTGRKLDDVNPQNELYGTVMKEVCNVSSLESLATLLFSFFLLCALYGTFFNPALSLYIAQILISGNNLETFIGKVQCSYTDL